MKRFFLIIILLLFTVHAGIRTVIFINWKIYQKEITEQYCINKSRPEMQCNGQCYLAKQMRAITQEYENSKTSFPPVNGKVVDILLFCNNFYNQPVSDETISQKELACFHYHVHKQQANLKQLTPPPQMLSSNS